jgi:hypothetical protein
MSRQSLVPVNVLASATAPTLPTLKTGDLYFNTVNNTLYSYSGTSWVSSGGSGGGVLYGLEANKPTYGIAGRVYISTDTYSLIGNVGFMWLDTGSAWEKVGLLPQDIYDSINGAVGYALGVSATNLTTAEAYTDTKIAQEVLDRNVNIANAKNEAIGISETYTDTSIATEVTNRNSAIATNLTTAKTYTDTSIATEVTNRNTAISSAISTEVTNRNTAISAQSVTDQAYTDTKVSAEASTRATAVTNAITTTEAYTDSSISTEVTNRNTAIASEASLRITGDATTLTSANTYTDGKFSALTTTGVPEGTNLYFTTGRVSTQLNAATTVGSGLTKSYNSGTGVLTLDVSSAIATLTGSQTLTNKTLTSPYINDVVVVTSTSTEINVLHGITATTSELNKTHGLTATTTELNYVAGVTSAIQTQVDGKSAVTHSHTGYQPVSTDLTAIAALNSGIGNLRRTGSGTWAIDTNAYALATSPTINTSIIAGTTSFNLLNTLATTINFGNAATTLTIGSNDATSVTTLNAPTLVGNLNYVNLFNTVATTVNFAGAATSLTIGGTPSTTITHNYSTNPTASGVTKTVNLATGNASGGITAVNIGSTTDGSTSSYNVNIPANYNKTVTVPYPTSSGHAANKQYVDNVAAGIIIKGQVYLGTTGSNLNAVYANGSSDSSGGLGVGATLTAAVNGALYLDGIITTVNSRVLVKDQTDSKQNGVYVVTNPGAGDAKWVLTRATDFNGDGTSGVIKPGAYVFVTNGTYYANASYVVSTSGTSTSPSGAIKVGTDVITFAQYSGVPLNISTLGNVTIGTWQATPISATYIDTAIARTANPTFTGHVTVPVVPTATTDAASKKYVDDLVLASLPYLPDIIPLDDLRYVFDGRTSRFAPKFQGIQQTLYNPYKLMINLNGIVQTPSYPEQTWLSLLPYDGFILDSDGYIAFSQVPPAGSTFDGRVMLGPNINTIHKSYPFKAVDVLLGI